MNDEKKLETLHNLKSQFHALELFIETALYRSYRKTFEIDLANVNENILATPPIDEPSRIHCLQLHARKDELLRGHTFFEDALTTLKERITQTEDAETQASDNQTN